MNIPNWWQVIMINSYGSFHVKCSSKTRIFHLTLSKINEISKDERCFLSWTMLKFFKSDLDFPNYEPLKFLWFWKYGWKIIGILLLVLQLIVTPISLNIFIQYFAIKCKVPCWTKQDSAVFTGDLWTLLITVIRQHVFLCIQA